MKGENLTFLAGSDPPCENSGLAKKRSGKKAAAVEGDASAVAVGAVDDVDVRCAYAPDGAVRDRQITRSVCGSPRPCMGGASPARPSVPLAMGAAKRIHHAVIIPALVGSS